MKLKNKLFALLSIALVLFTNITAYAKTDAAGDVNSALGGIVAYKLSESGAADTQGFLDGYLTENAGKTGEWYVVAILGSGESYDHSKYETALADFVNEANIPSATTREKYALVLTLLGKSDPFIEKTANDSIGELGIMSYVFGLHLLNNDVSSEKYTKEAVIEQLLSMRLSDGGWALRGEVSDVDVTAMTLAALAPAYRSEHSSALKTAVDEALALLSERQNPAGDFAGFGKDNAESTAQVLFALSSLGIDGAKDQRFIKDGSVVDGLLKYKNADGSFSHEGDGTANESATTQSYYALMSYVRFLAGKGPLFVADGTEKADASESDSPRQGGETEDRSKEDPKEDKEAVDCGTEDPENQGPNAPADNSGSGYKGSLGSFFGSYKVVVTLIIAGFFLLTSLVLFLQKKRNIKNYIFLALVAAALIAVTWLTTFQSKESFYGANAEDAAYENAEKVTCTVTMSISCTNLAGKYEGEYIPSDGVILPATTFAVSAGESVYDVLIKAARKYEIQTDTKGSGGMVYVSGINYLYELAYGDLSGWMYKVNGKTPSVGCGEYAVADGDVIEWMYTLELGNDLD